MFDAKTVLDAMIRGGGQEQLSLELPSGDQPAKSSSPNAPPHAGALDDMLRKITGGQGSFSEILAKLQQQGGDLPEFLRQVLGQATTGVREGASRIDDATGASRHARDAITQATGHSPEEMVARLK